jgi:mannose-6-phosphate isomerase-like protein (cupin superfamily)
MHPHPCRRRALRTTTGQDLRYHDSLYVITMTSGKLDIVFEEGEMMLRPGDSVLLPGSVHDLRNPTDEPAGFIYTSFPLAR